MTVYRGKTNGFTQNTLQHRILKQRQLEQRLAKERLQRLIKKDKS